MIKVFQVIPTLGVGGAEKIALDIASNVDEKKINMTILSLYDSDKTNFDISKFPNVKIVTFSKKKGLDIKLIIKLIKYFKTEKPDVVHTHLYAAPYVFFPCMVAGVKNKIHTVHSIASKELTIKKRKIMNLLYKKFNFKPIAICDFVKQSIIEEYNLLEKNVPCIYNGIDLRKFKKKEKKTKNEKYTFIHVGRFIDVKNHELLIKSFYKFLKNNINSKLILVGDGPLKQDIKKLVNELKINDYVEFVGISSNVEDYLNKANCFVMTSKYEGFPLSLIEAMACGVPVISTKVGGIVDIVENEKNGFFVEATENDICKKMELVYNNLNLTENCSIHALKTAKKFDIKDMVNNYEKLYLENSKDKH